MNKKIKKLCTIALTLAITATSSMSMSVSAYTDMSNFAGHTIVDDKGLMSDWHKKYEMICLNNNTNRFVCAEANFRIAKFILSEDVNYEEANERIIEIFEEFYPDNYLCVSEVPTGENAPAKGSNKYLEYLDDYCKNYKPNLWSDTVDGVTTYTLCATYRQEEPSIEEEKIAEVRKYSKDFMKKLNEEKLISAFYDFGEVYEASGPYYIYLNYSLDADIDLIQNYIDEHNIDCIIEKDDYQYTLKFNDELTNIERFLIAADIYEETSIKISFDRWYVPAIALIQGSLYGKNALEEITMVENPTPAINISGDANEDETIDIRDAAFIARKVAQRKVEELPEWADYNNDNKLDILDAAAIARDVARRILK